MVQVKYVVDGIWEPNDPMTLHWERPFATHIKTATVSSSSFTLPRYDDLYFKSMAILDKEDNQIWYH